MRATFVDLWGLTFGKRWIDAEAMATAMESQVEREDLDFRSRLLIRDSLEALVKTLGGGPVSVVAQQQSGARDA